MSKCGRLVDCSCQPDESDRVEALANIARTQNSYTRMTRKELDDFTPNQGIGVEITRAD